jgi:UDP-2-acetamido-2,6-beta-L-arabino-hexul-4-ose reductase
VEARGMSYSNSQVIGITGPSGFIASHLARRLSGSSADSKESGVRVLGCSRQDLEKPDSLRTFVGQCNTIVHLAGMNRGDETAIYETNVALVELLIDALAATNRRPHIIFASSTQRDLTTAYGRSKKQGEERLRRWAQQHNAKLTILVIPNVYGPGCRPFYNSVVATFCHQLAHGQRPVVIDDQQIEFVWMSDLVEAIVDAINTRQRGIQEARIAGTAHLTVSQLLARLEAIHHSYFEANVVPDLSDPLDARLYTTFLSHVDLDDHCHRPRVHSDARGKLFEILRLAGGGQIFFSTTRPGVIRGNHFHSRKVEWFCVLRGEAVIRLRPVGGKQIREFRVSGELPQFISIPALHTHQIENIGEDDLLTMFWCNEIFQPADPDTYYEQVA